jgi:hypothetical protein
MFTYLQSSLDSDWVMGWVITGFEYQQGQVVYLSTKTSKAALAPTQFLSQWVPGVLSLGLKQRGHDADPAAPGDEVTN